MHQSKQVHGIPNRSELIHLQYFSFEFYLQFSSFQIQRKPAFIYSVKIQSLQDLSTLQLQSRLLNMQSGQILIRNSVIHCWREYLRCLYSVCATIFVQISVTEKILSTISLFFGVNQSSSSSIQQQWTGTYQLGKVFLNEANFVFKLD